MEGRLDWSFRIEEARLAEIMASDIGGLYQNDECGLIVLLWRRHILR